MRSSRSPLRETSVNCWRQERWSTILWSNTFLRWHQQYSCFHTPSAKTRGNFRRAKGTCYYPPLLLHFSRENSRNTLFSDQDKLKLVMPCQGDDYVIREYLVYKMYNLITPLSFRARLVKIILNDPQLKSKSNQDFLRSSPRRRGSNGKPETTWYRSIACRYDLNWRRPMLFLNMVVFGIPDWQYRLVCTNTDRMLNSLPRWFCNQTLHRAYDFDHAGIVNSPYARPAPELKLSSVRQRRFRGICIQDMDYYKNVLAHYQSLKDSIYSLYTSNTLLEKGYVKSTVRYLDEFYRIINNPKKTQRGISIPVPAPWNRKHRDQGIEGIIVHQPFRAIRSISASTTSTSSNVLYTEIPNRVTPPFSSNPNTSMAWIA